MLTGPIKLQRPATLNAAWWTPVNTSTYHLIILCGIGDFLHKYTINQH